MVEQKKPNAEEPQGTEEVLEAAEEAEQRPSECDELKE